MEFNFRKFFYIVAILGGGVWYASKHVSWEDVHKWAKARPVAADREKYVYYLGMMYYSQDKCGEAIDAFREVMTEEATGQYEPRALMRMGRCYQDIRRFEEARAAYERYIEVFPKGADIELVKNNYEFVKFR